MRQGFVKKPLILQGIAQIVMRLREKRLELDGPAIAGGRLVRLPLIQKRVAKTIMRARIVSVEVERSSEACDSLVRSILFPKGLSPDNRVTCLVVVG